MTNYEDIKNMSELELANFLSEVEYKAISGKSKYVHEWEMWLDEKKAVMGDGAENRNSV